MIVERELLQSKYIISQSHTTKITINSLKDENEFTIYPFELCYGFPILANNHILKRDPFHEL